MGDHGLHDWWYGASSGPGSSRPGTTRGERMHKARHTAGQRVLDATGNLKAVQKLLGHASIQTTGDMYADWDIDQLAQTLRGMSRGRPKRESFPPAFSESLQIRRVCAWQESNLERSLAVRRPHTGACPGKEQLFVGAR